MTQRRALPPALRPPLAIATVFGVVGFVVLAVLFCGDSAGSAFDVWALSVLDDGVRQPSLGYGFAWVVGTIGDPMPAVVLVVVVAAVFLVLRRRRLAVLALAGTALTGVATTLLKPVVGRTIDGDHLSFPSGHTALLTGLAMVIALFVVDLCELGGLAGGLLVPGAAVLGGAAMSWSQTASNVHYATDTFGGFCVALAVVPATAWLIDRIADRPRAVTPGAPPTKSW